MIKFIFSLICLGSLGYGIWRLSDAQPELKDKAMQLVPASGYHAFEPRFTAEQIMESQRANLLQSPTQQYRNFAIEYHPFLLLEVKFTQNDLETGEGIILWDLIDGEMVLSTETWDKSHGFADCIHAHADQREFEILNAMAEKGNQADRQTLLNALKSEGTLLDTWLERCLKKKLIVKQGNLYRIHLQNPHIAITPATSVTIPLVTKTSKHPEKLKKRFSSSQIIRTAEAAFGANFAIRNSYDVYIPIYSLTIQNGDGSLHTTHWNSLNGKRLPHSSLMD